MDMLHERLAQVGRMLKRLVTVEEAIEMMAPFDRPFRPKKRKRGKNPVASPAVPPGDGGQPPVSQLGHCSVRAGS
jgi:hypothetical protein